MSFAGYFPFLFFLMSSRFYLVWLRVSCDHGWIRSESVNVRYNNNKNCSTYDSGYRGSIVGLSFVQIEGVPRLVYESRAVFRRKA